MDWFKEAYESTIYQFSAVHSANANAHFLKSVQNEINTGEIRVSAQTSHRPNMAVAQSKGFIAEECLMWSQRARAVARGHKPTAYMPESTALGSPDIMVDGKAYSSKFYKTTAQSVNEQAVTIRARYEEACRKVAARGKEYMSLEEYMKRYFPNAKSDSESIYRGQGKVIPFDPKDPEHEKIKEALRKKIARERDAGHNDIADSLQDVHDTLTCVVTDKHGIPSDTFTLQEIEEMTQAAKEGRLKEYFEQHGISAKRYIRFQDVMRESLKAGASAAAMTFVLSFSPIVLNAFSQLIESGEIDVEQFKKQGLSALNRTAESFILGTISGGVVAAAKMGLLGQSMTAADPTIIGATVAFVYAAIGDGIQVASGKMTMQEYVRNTTQALFVSAGAVGVGLLAQSLFVSVPGAYLLGSFVGSAIGGLLYTATEKVFLSYCVESGFTLFGLVNQDYTIDEELLREIGIDIFEQDTFETPTFIPESFECESFECHGFQYEHFGVSIIRRGVIGVFSIGYC